MKRIVILSTLLIFLFLPKSNAQQFHFVTSFGVTQSWGMPYEVVHVIEHDYCGYDVVHTRRINQNGKLFFDVVLQRGNVFVTVNVGRYGRVYRRAVAYDYPFYDHVCGNVCGYNTNFYRRNVTICNSHHHQGHNHVAYGHHGHVTQSRNVYVHKSSTPKRPKDYRDTNSYKSRQNSVDYQNKSSRKVVSGAQVSYPSRSKSTNSGSSVRSDNKRSSGSSGASSSASGRSASARSASRARTN